MYILSFVHVYFELNFEICFTLKSHILFEDDCQRTTIRVNE